jgi:hypothetical protein
MTFTHISEHAARLYDGIIAAQESGVGKRQVGEQRRKTVGGQRKIEHDTRQSNEMSIFWDGELGMEDECQRIMESIRGEEANKGKSPGTNGGRIWVYCISCGRAAVLVRQGWVERNEEQAAKEKNGFVVSVCGSCERKNGEIVGKSGTKMMKVVAEMVTGSLGYRAVAEHCARMGWEEVCMTSGRVIDRKTLLGKQWAGMTVRSVRIEDGKGEEEGEEWRVRVMGYLDAAFMG